MLYNLFQFLTGIHGTQIKGFDHRPSSRKLGCVVRRRRKLFNNFATYTSSRLLPAHHRAITKIAFHKEYHFLIPNQHLVTAHYVEPSLQGSLNSCFVFFSSDARRCDSWRYSRDKSFWIRGYEVFTKLFEF
jgi:hypothetical protein